MMARSTRSNQRPDTLMQDRICQIDENLLQRTAGPYSWVISSAAAFDRLHECFMRRRSRRERQHK
jgi:hypothetical protein